jgi:hypothetical protein
MMGGAKLAPKVIAAFRSAGATEEMIAGATQIVVAMGHGSPGRPRKYKNRAERDRAYKLRKQERDKPRISTPERDETRISTPDPMKDMAVAIAETIVAALPQVEPSALHVLLVNAARWNVDSDADVAPIRAHSWLMRQWVGRASTRIGRNGTARPRKYKNRAERDRAYKLRRKERDKTREIISTPIEAVHREDYHGLRARLIDASNGNIDALADISPIRALIEQGCDFEADEAPPPARCLSAMDWDEFVAGHRAGLIEWNRTRLSRGWVAPLFGEIARFSRQALR